MTSIRKIKRLKPVNRPIVRVVLDVGGIQVFGLGPVRHCTNLNDAREVCAANTHGARLIRARRRFLPTVRTPQQLAKAWRRREVKAQKHEAKRRSDILSEPAHYIYVRPAPQQGAKP